MNVNLAIFLLLASQAIWAVARADDALPNYVKNVYAEVESKVVQLTVSGKRDGSEVKGSLGIGCVFQTPTGVRIITAKHVVGSDAQFDVVPGNVSERQREISIRVPTAFGQAAVNQSAHSVREHPSMDIAEVVPPGAERATGLYVSMEPIASNDRVVVITWPQDHERPIPTEAIVLPREGKDGAHVRLKKEFFEGDSGSPVFNEHGALVAVIVTKSTSSKSGSSTLALPLSEFKDWLMSAGYIQADDEAARKEKERLAEMFRQVIAKIHESQNAKREAVFPAFEEYRQNPSQETWDKVIYSIKQSLEPIEEGIRLSREYDAQIAPIGKEASAELQYVRSNFVDRSYSGQFSEVRQTWNGFAFENQRILKTERRPDPREAEMIEMGLHQKYAQLAHQLEAISDRLMALR